MTTKADKMREIIELRNKKKELSSDKESKLPSAKETKPLSDEESSLAPKPPSSKETKPKAAKAPKKKASDKSLSLIADYADLTPEDDPKIKVSVYLRQSQQLKLMHLAHLYAMRKKKKLDSSQIIRYLLDTHLNKIHEEFKKLEPKNPFDE